jgi:GT2 family glycosyltransferase
LFAKVGGFDERYAAECQDSDLCLRVNRLGVGCRVLDAGPLVHIENATRPKGEENWLDRALFIRRWSSYIEML